MIKNLIAMLAVVCSTSAEAQVLATAEPLHKDEQLVMLAENVLADGDDKLNIAYALYAKNISRRFDAYVAAGTTHIDGEGQAQMGWGGNFQLFAFSDNAVSVFGMAWVPLHRRNEAATVLFNPAVIVSRALSPKVSLYTGVNSLIPVGKHEQDLFTPRKTKVNVPVGVALFLGRWGVNAEADFGNLKAVGVSVGRIF